MNSRFKLFAFYNSLQYLCDFIHVEWLTLQKSFERVDEELLRALYFLVRWASKELAIVD